MNDLHNGIFDGTLWDTIKNAPAKETILRVVTDEEGHEVHIVNQVTTGADGSILDNSLLAVYPDGTLYPEHADKIVMAAIRELVAEGREQA